MKIIAYGSLMNSDSLAASLGRPAHLTKITVHGYSRVFNAPFDGYAFLNLKPTPEESIEAAYFELQRPELAHFAVREAGAEIIEIIPNFYAFIWSLSLAPEIPVLQSYINFCDSAARAMGINFWHGLIMPTSTIIDDREKPLYGLDKPVKL